METEAVVAILAAAQLGQIDLLGSEALDYETDCIPDPERRRQVAAMLELASEYLTLTSEVETLAFNLESLGVSAMDAVHVALASTAKADYFATCDDQLLRKARAAKPLGCQVVGLLSLVTEVLNDNTP